MKGFQPGNVLTSYTGYGGGKGEVDNSTVVGGKAAAMAEREDAEQRRNAPAPSAGPKFCSNCGAKNTGGKICSECGNKF